MAASSFSEVVRRVRLYASTAPLFLVEDWVNIAYKQICNQRHWSFLRGDTTLVIQEARALASVAVVQGSSTVSSLGLFLPADLDRQLKVGSYPYYTILAVNSDSSITLDRAYGAATNSDTPATILDAYVTMPVDFASFRSIIDPYNRRFFPFWGAEDELLLRDPYRTESGQPQALVPATPSPITPTIGYARYEWWPVSPTARAYPARYNKQEDRLTDSDTFAGVLADAGEIIVIGALAQAAEWPGSPDMKNPYFNLGLAERKKQDFAIAIQKLSLRDDEAAPDDLLQVDWSQYDSLAATDRTLRSSDATVADYF